jgi:hypothetical protein
MFNFFDVSGGVCHTKRHVNKFVRRRKFMQKLFALILLGIGSGVVAMAAVPEIDPASAGSALALLAGTLLVIRGRRRK